MEWLTRSYASLSTPAGGAQDAPSTIAKLADRLASSTLLEDRRAAVLSLKGLSRDWKKDVGDIALKPLVAVLADDAQHDPDLAKALFETLNTVCERDVGQDGRPLNAKDDLGIRFTDSFLESQEPIQALLGLLSQTNFYTRFSALQFLSTLLSNRTDKVQAQVLVAPGGCGRLLECLDDKREIIRNETLLLLTNLTASNADIQKIVAFEGAFERLLEIVHLEGGIEGGIVAQDCLECLGGLLRWNVSNQNYFREVSAIPLLAPLLLYPVALPPAAMSRSAEAKYSRELETFAMQAWDEQKAVNASLVIALVGLLVGGQGKSREGNQNALLASGLTKCLFELALASSAPPLLKAQALNVLASVLRSSRPNQDFLSSLLICPLLAINPEPASDTPPSRQSATSTPRRSLDLDAARPGGGKYTRLPARPAILTLIATAIHGGQMFGFRVAAVNCFESFITGNPDAQLGIISTMSPPDSNSNDASGPDRPQSAGTLLLAGLSEFPTTTSASTFDPYKPLLSAILFCHLIRNSEQCKAIAREVSFGGDAKDSSAKEEADAEADEDDKVSLVHVLIGNLMMAGREQSESARRALGSADGDAHLQAGSVASAADWARVMVGYLVVLCTWLWDSPGTVREFLGESANLQVLIQPVAQSSGVDPLVQGLCAFLLGICYEFNTEPGPITRATLHPILHSRIGADQFSSRLIRLRDDPRFQAVGPEVFEMLMEEQTGRGDDLGGFWFDWAFVDFWKNNYVTIQRSILSDPDSSSRQAPSNNEMEALQQVTALRETLSVQSQEIEQLNSKMMQMRTAHEEEREALLKEINTLTRQTVELKSELDATAREKQGAEKERDEVRAKLEAAAEKGGGEEGGNGEGEREDLLLLLEELSVKRRADKAKLRELGQEVSDSDDDDEDEGEE